MIRDLVVTFIDLSLSRIENAYLIYEGKTRILQNINFREQMKRDEFSQISS